MLFFVALNHERLFRESL